MSVDLPGHGDRTAEAAELVPWRMEPELRCALAELRGRWDQTALFGHSLGAWFGLTAFQGLPLAGALLLSPVVDMEALIQKMMGWAGVTEAQLALEGSIHTDFGQTLSWAYLRHVRTHPLRRWTAPTSILYGGRDHLTDRETVEAFARRWNCRLTVEPEGEHWFHTPEQLAAVDRWQRESLRALG